MRNKFASLAGFMVCLFMLAACSKEKQFSGTASLTIFNGVIGSNFLVTNFNGTEPVKWYSNAKKIGYGSTTPAINSSSNNDFHSWSGDQHLALFEYPDTTVHHNPVFNLRLSLPVGTINSLFLTGTIDDPDTLFIRDVLPYHPADDSSMSFRFVNLSHGTRKLSVNLLGKATGSEAAALGFKQVSEFRKYAMDASTNSYVFEIRYADNDQLLLTYPLDVRDQNASPTLKMNTFRFKSFTLILFGDPAAAGTTRLRANHTKNF